MFSSIRLFVYSAVGMVVLMITLSVLGAVVERSTAASTTYLKALYEKGTGVVFGTLFFLLSFTIIPVALRIFVRMQTWAGNTELPMVAFIRQHECTITYVVWGIIAIFILVMLPTIKQDMMSG